MKVVTLLSGGLDSTTMLAMLLAEHEVVALTLEYGSRHELSETAAARNVAKHYGVEHFVLRLPKKLFGNSALIDKVLPLDRPLEEIHTTMSPAYVPARNAVLLSCASALAGTLEYDAVSYAAHATDGPAYYDTTPEFFKDAGRMLSHYPQGRVILAPFITWYKPQIIEQAAIMRVPLQLTFSCYAGSVRACGRCDTCRVRIEAFQKAGYVDPVEYITPPEWEECKQWPT